MVMKKDLEIHMQDRLEGELVPWVVVQQTKMPDESLGVAK